ncbi:LOW QUALITY PROTEIN: GSXL2-like protein [Mya arenaria]|uniref:L-ornithine N(5)-monooxygenase [NAD(P)H] n=1 Tax=Mya arenaria TaxID=6604 RepID=A0ABY7FJA4_MYAAR|nr:LOW QUALITY PROTEIN: GSXL2-like protein [Mya arenaria]
MFDYLKGRWTNNAGRDLEQYITYSTVVRSVIYTENTEMFTVTVNDLKTGAIRTEQFTHVCVAYLTSQMLLQLQGIEAFDGRVVHSHDIKDGVELKNQNDLIVGSSHSAVDIALHIMTYGGKSVIVSWRTKAPNHIWPKGITEKCEVESIQGQIVTFKDGSSAVVDSIFLCTGYKTLFPFLENRLRIAEETSFYQSELYKGSLFLPVAQSKLFFVGAQDQLYTLTFIMFFLPNEPKSTEEMQKYADDWHGRVKHLKCLPDFIEFQASFISDLAEDTQYGMEYTKAVPLFLEHIKARDVAIAHGRNIKFALFLSE